MVIIAIRGVENQRWFLPFLYSLFLNNVKRNGGSYGFELDICIYTLQKDNIYLTLGTYGLN